MATTRAHPSIDQHRSKNGYSDRDLLRFLLRVTSLGATRTGEQRRDRDGTGERRVGRGEHLGRGEAVREQHALQLVEAEAASIFGAERQRLRRDERGAVGRQRLMPDKRVEQQQPAGGEQRALLHLHQQLVELRDAVDQTLIGDHEHVDRVDLGRIEIAERLERQLNVGDVERRANSPARIFIDNVLCECK
jgi:hypothetical protein